MKGKERKGGSLSVAREENVKDGRLAGSVHHLGGERAGRGKVGHLSFTRGLRMSIQLETCRATRPDPDRLRLSSYGP